MKAEISDQKFNMVVKQAHSYANNGNSRTTNAKAERLNGKIQRFVFNNYGLKYKDFFLYRSAGYFS
jgi:hypothetical protein